MAKITENPNEGSFFDLIREWNQSVLERRRALGVPVETDLRGVFPISDDIAEIIRDEVEKLAKR